MVRSTTLSFLKFTGYVLIITLLSIGIITVLDSKINTDAELKKQVDFANKSSKIYFVGTSRVRQSINTHQLQKMLKFNGVYNLGLSGSSFLYNCLLAQKLISISPTQSIIFVELCSSQPTPPAFYTYFYSIADCMYLLKKHFGLNISFEKMDSIIFYFLSLKEPIKVLLGTKLALKPEIGYVNDSTIFNGNNETLITFQEIAEAKDELNSVQHKYLRLMEELIKEGKKNNVNIVFFVPTTIKDVKEKTLTFPIFNKILPENRWLYSPEFLTKMNKTSYLSDENHLNKYGAKVYTEEIMKKIKSMNDFNHIHSQALK